MKHALCVIARYVAVGILLAAVHSVTPANLQTQVSAHHCFGHLTDDNVPVNIAECADAGACLDSEAPNCSEQSSNTLKVNNILKLVVNILSILVGVAAVIMIIVGGFKYITSAGDPAHLTSAKNTIIYAIIGLVIVALAQILVQFTLNKSRSAAGCPSGQTVQPSGACG